MKKTMMFSLVSFGLGMAGGMLVECAKGTLKMDNAMDKVKTTVKDLK